MTVGGRTKAQWRSAVLRARRELTPARRSAEADAIRAALSTVVERGDVVCAYVPVASEPGSVDMLDAMVAAGARVLLPVARDDDGTPVPLSWGTYRGDALVEAPFGLREPAPPHEPPQAIASAALVLVPALAVDRRGVRLGRGAGYYDRSLPLIGPGARLCAVVRDEEFVAELPGEAHDVAMTHVLTPGRGLFELPRR
ncbi:5-formyltetrahydrofolate cyclo-ligase [Mycolicibacterium lacusdiani]|uniref:5-formyltetrahydrofolate cyclo-ligase n=1 Tax=Mycolicibacterium lacusdiani TaxID=2895283 RepID=UPI001F017172|nr:5-formyltetrahydrofolate cyclo-ligase [Mycolicibacterium lacusdiani]